MVTEFASAFALIAAVARNGVIGLDNRLPWRLPEDLRRFRALTIGHSVVMGRRTWESLSRALPERQNIVVTRSADYRAEGAVTSCRSLPPRVRCFHRGRTNNGAKLPGSRIDSTAPTDSATHS